MIGSMGANIIEVAHNRLALDVPAKGAEFDIMIETRDAQHTQEIMDALRGKENLVPNSKIIVLTNFEQDEESRAAMEKGAPGAIIDHAGYLNSQRF